MEDELVYFAKQKLYSFVALFVAFMLLVACIIISNRRLVSEDKNDPVNKYFTEQKILIEAQTKKLQNQVDSLYIKISENNLKLDKLSKLKTQIRYVYINESKEIDGLNNAGIIKEFNTFFTKANNKQ
jgi:hypothetical protein